MESIGLHGSLVMLDRPPLDAAWLTDECATLIGEVVAGRIAFSLKVRHFLRVVVQSDC
jgi:hypothetical protein